MKVWKKLAGVVLALAVMMTLCVSALAVTNDLNNPDEQKAGIAGRTPSQEPTAMTGTSFTVDLSNDSDSNGMPRPVQEYTYAITGAGVTFSDSQPSPAAKTTTTTAKVTFPAVANGAAASQATVRLDFNASATGVTITDATSTAPGLKYYSVTLTQTAPDGTTTETYTLYVYVSVNGDSKTPYAAILTDANSWSENIAAASKKTGFVNEFTASVQSVTLEKVLDGSMADPNQDFPFTVKIVLPEAYRLTGTEIDVDSTSTASSGNLFADYTLVSDDITATGFEMSGQLKGGENVVFNNLPVGTEVSVKETTNSALRYTITSAITGTETKTVQDGTNVNTETDYTTTATIETGHDVTITYTNFLDAISPTGVVLRFAPYFAMLGAGLTTMVIAPRRKEEE